MYLNQTETKKGKNRKKGKIQKNIAL